MTRKFNPFASYEPYTKGFLVDTVTGERLTFQYNPETFDITKQPKWATIEVPGLSNPKYQYVGGGEKKISFKLDFYRAPGMTGDKIAKILDFLESLTYPDYGIKAGSNFEKGAHPVLFNFGKFFQNFRCFVSNYKATPEYLFEPKTLLPLKASVELELTELPYVPAKNKAYGGAFKSRSYNEIRYARYTSGTKKVNL